MCLLFLLNGPADALPEPRTADREVIAQAGAPVEVRPLVLLLEPR